MPDPVPFTEHAERLQIKGKPRQVTRINRKVLMLGAGLGALALFAAASIALAPPRVAGEAGRELYNTTNKRTPEGLNALPSSYAEIAPVEERIARLGAPLPGDLGATVLATERDLGVEYPPIEPARAPYTPNPADEAERARQLREAKLAEDAAAAPVFFQLQSKSGSQAGRVDQRSETVRDLSSELLALAAARPELPGFEAEGDANLQSRKLAFANDRIGSDVYNSHQLERPASPYQVMSGTLIAASLITGLNSDLPGTVIAQVTQPVYDTVTGTHLLIPQGARLIGRYQSEVSFGQDRALLIWDRIIFPDGASIQISAPGADAGGYAGVADRTDHHWDRVFAAAGLATILGIGAELGSDDDDIERAVRRGISDTVNQAGQRAVDRSLGIQPTIKVRPGWPVRVIVTRDLILSPIEEVSR